jgi:hypothetical protein
MHQTWCVPPQPPSSPTSLETGRPIYNMVVEVVLMEEIVPSSLIVLRRLIGALYLVAPVS